MTTAGLAGLAMTAAPLTFGQNATFGDANRKIKIGVIGTGVRGTGIIHFLNQIKGLEVIACCDVLPFRLDRALEITDGTAKGYSDYRKLLENKDVDAVVVTTPFHAHARISIDALDAGKHVYAEKTMAKGYEDIRNVVHASRNSDLIFQTGHQYHSSRLYTHVADLIREGKVGEITAMECQWNRNGNWRREVPEPSLEREINWRMYREFSGGLPAELCSHQIDFTNWILGENPEKVIGMGGVDYWKDGRETYDNVHLLYQYPKGVKAKFTCLTNNSKDGYQIKVIGDKGTIILDFRKAWFYPEKIEQKRTGVIDGISGATLQWDAGKGIPIEVEHADPTMQALIDFQDNILNNTIPESNVITGANVSIAVQMALDALDRGEPVHWKKDVFKL